MNPIRSNTARTRAGVKPAPALLCLLILLILVQPLSGVSSTLWPSNAVPGLADSGDPSSLELGVKFSSETAGNILGVRFYKASANTGIHIGNLWTTNGTLLASAPFTNESASGWQQISFTNPVAIDAGTVYVASYLAANGHYSYDAGYLATNVDNPPLHAPSSSVSGGNGVFASSATSVFPTNSFNAANYWVDVLFQAGPDVTPPTVNSVSPRPGASWAHVGAPLTISFSEAIDPSTINTGTIVLRDASNGVVPATVSYNAAAKTATLTPSSLLTVATNYTATVSGGVNGVADLAGNRMTSDFVWSFNTLPANPYGGGSGGPILLITDRRNPFSDYCAEILLTEGLNEFALQDISTVSNQTLASYDVVILGKTALIPSQVAMLSTWVNAGGQLIAMRPDKQLAGLLGLSDAGATMANAYLLVNTSSGPGVGIVDQSMQYHGTADAYNLSGATSVATLYSTAVTPTTFPAVTVQSVGSNGGQAAAFTFDLAQSIVYTRQGNPAWSGENRDGLTPIRSDDLFFGAAGFDPEPDWIDLRKVPIPQADEEQRLLANLILSMNSTKRLLPRFWYFPDGRKAVVVMTGDDHAKHGTRNRFDQFLADSPTNAVPGDWQNIRGSSYLFPYPAPIDGGPQDGPILTDTEVSNYVAQGFEIGLHLDTGCTDFTWDSLDSMFTSELNTLASMYPSLPPPRTHRCHCVAWSQYSAMPEVERAHGIRLDTGYYYWPASWSASWPGVFTGSAMPMRFSTADGSVIDVYQAATQMTDESGQVYPYTTDTLLDRALGPEGYYGAFVANMHTDYNPWPQCDAMLASASNHGVAIISADQLLTWVDARNSSSFNSIVSTSGTLTFSVAANTNAVGLQAMAPVPGGYSVSQVKSNGIPAAFALSRIKGVQYAVFPAPTGSYEVDFATDTTPPSVTSILPANATPGVGLRTKVSITFSKSMNAATLNASTITLRDSLNNLVAAAVSYNPSTLTALLAPQSTLSLSSTYTVTVQGGAGGVADVAGNHLPGNLASSFATINQFASSIWDNTAIPAILSSKDTNVLIGTAELGTVSIGDTNAVELGLKFQSAMDGFVTGIRFYKGGANTGTHVGNLWTAAGTLLASVTFSNETASGWQVQALTNRVPISSNTTYIVSYHTPAGGYSVDPMYFAGSGVDSYPLRALADGENGPNALFSYSTSSTFPIASFNAANYWVDLTFVGNTDPGTNPPAVTSTSPTPGATGVNPALNAGVAFSKAMDPSSVNTNTLVLRDSSNTVVTATVSYNPATFKAVLTPISRLALTATYNANVQSGSTGVKDLVGNPMTNDFVWSFTTASQLTFSIWNDSYVPAVVSVDDTNSTELGVKFQSAVNGYITGISFYKGLTNTGPHLGNLWTSDGTLLASVTFTNESASGWQFQPFAAAVPIASNTTYLASYYTPSGFYSADTGYFAGSGFTNYPLRALADGEDGANGVYSYSTNSVFPTNTFNSANYWVDVTFLTNAPPIVITTASVPDAVVNVPYSATLTASGGILPFSWSIISGSLPPGLVLNSANGAITGTPTTAGIFNFTPQVTDSSNPTQNTSLPFTLVTSLGTITSIWPSSAAPGLVDAGADAPVELGVKFVSDVAGTISGIRFYKSAANTGTHIGDLWTTNQSLLASAVFTGESASGWQQVTFTTPVIIASNTVYVASYHANNGHYSADLNYFSSAGVDNPPLHALADAVSGGNGVFAYSTNSIFPTLSFSAANYWVDVVFVSSLAPVLPAQTNLAINELTLLTVTNTAIDADIPALPLTYTLLVTNLVDNSVVTNASIDTNGVITWTPTEAQGPGTNLFTTIVSDGSISATNSFVVTVNEVNSAPVLPVQGNLTLDDLTALTVTNTATDSDIPANNLSYALLAAPSGSSIDTNGIITWTPLSAQGNSTNLFTTVVTDDGLPPLSATNSFLVFVNPAPVIPQPVIQSITLSNNIVTVTWSSVSRGIYQLQYNEDLTQANWTDLAPDVHATGTIAAATNAVSNSTQRFYRVWVVPLP